LVFVAFLVTQFSPSLSDLTEIRAALTFALVIVERVDSAPQLPFPSVVFTCPLYASI
jgi:hypothetical protein